MSKARHRWLRLLAMLFAFALVATACGSSGDGASAADTGAEEPETEADGGDEEAMADDEEAMADEGALISDECPIHAPAESTTIDLMGWEFPVTAQIGEELEDCNSDNLSVNVQLLDNTSAQDQLSLIHI